MIRRPVVEGLFYPKSEARLRDDIQKMMAAAAVDASVVWRALAFVAPHAGYRYSGGVAAYAYRALMASSISKGVETVAVVGPNHTGYGAAISVSTDDWLTPLGVVECDKEFSDALSNANFMTVNEAAHSLEHSVEVQLPFLQSTLKDVKCVFICMGDQSPDASRAVADALFEAKEALGRRITVIASSDFDHYEPADVARGKDMPAIDAICELDIDGFYDAIARRNDSACGFGPIAAAARFARAEGARAGHLLKYANSGDVTGDYSSVVAYASIAFA